MTRDIAASIKARLLNHSRLMGEDFERTLTRFVVERLLFRLGASASSSQCILKGGALLAFWMSNPYRATRDVDLLAYGRTDEAAISRMLESVLDVPCEEDGVRFDKSQLTIESIRSNDEHVGRRVRFQAFLGKARVTVQIDIGIGDAVVIRPETITYPTVLTKLPAPQLLAYPRVQTIAEKFEAMAILGTRNSRMKDFHDVWALSGCFAFRGKEFRDAIEACFARRRTPLTCNPPRVLTHDFYRIPEIKQRWIHYLAAGTVLVQPPRAFEEIGERVINFLKPLHEHIVGGLEFPRAWPPGGPWSEDEHALKVHPPTPVI